LVLANGKDPNPQNAFPISFSVKLYKSEIDNRKRLQAVDPLACALIDSLQPLHFAEADREKVPLAMLDALTNINKPRRVLLTNLERAVLEDEPLRFPHLLGDLTGIMPDGVKHTFTPYGSYIAFSEDAISGGEIGTALNVFGDFIGSEVLPLFQRFFKLP
jgi:hypothetical protein